MGSSIAPHGEDADAGTDCSTVSVVPPNRRVGVAPNPWPDAVILRYSVSTQTRSTQGPDAQSAARLASWLSCNCDGPRVCAWADAGAPIAMTRAAETKIALLAFAFVVMIDSSPEP